MAAHGSTFPRVCLSDQVVKDNPNDFPISHETAHIQNWGKPEYDQSKWPLLELNYLKETGTVCWVRTHVNIGDDIESYRDMGLIVAQVGAFEVYWDGIYIGGSGQVGYSKHEEKPDVLRTFVKMPDELLSKGHHVIGIKNSNYHRMFLSTDYNFTLEWQHPPSIYLDLSSQSTGALFSLGACLLVGLFYLSYYFVTERNSAYLLISLLSFSVSAFSTAIISQYIDISYPYIKFSSTAQVTFAGLSCWLLPIFLVQLYQPNNRRYWLIAPSIILIIGLAVPASWTTKSIIASAGCLLVSLILIVMAIKNEKRGAAIVLAGIVTLVAVLIFDPRNFISDNFSLAFLILIVCLLFSLNLESRDVKLDLEKTKFAATRLQLDLIKRNIKPHFMMNTLTSIMECIEQDKHQGIKFIQSLAHEFNLINQVSDKQLIDIGEEIELCQYHLQIMSFQRQIQFSLVLKNIEPDLTIPPGVFHTLVENGITHNRYREAKISFKLSQEPCEQGARCYRLATPFAGESSRKTKSSGLGIKYIKARLQESYGNSWKIEQGVENNDWITRVMIY